MARQSHRQAPAAHPEEQSLLQGIVNHPEDAARWLILADWLEENDDPRRAELLRLHRKLIDTCCEPDQHPERGGQQARMVQLLTEGVRACVPRRTLALSKRVEMDFAWIPPGTFLMGSPLDELDREKDELQHRVTLTRGFWLALTPVTQAQWRAVWDVNPSHHKSKLRPVEMVRWGDSQEYCRRLGEKVGKRLRLPTEAEWEYACRAGTSTPFFWGGALSTEQANYNGLQPYGSWYDAGYLMGVDEKGVYREETTVVAAFPCNAWGLYDMHGNVWEWCQDWHGGYANGPVNNPRGPKQGGVRVLRGGSYHSQASWCRSAFRYGDGSGARSPGCGCRVVLCPD